jgi:DNA-binding CsgD family transcriptional regulator
MKVNTKRVRKIDDILLSQRETECIEHLLRGSPSREIGKTLGLSHRTVEGYLKTIKEKLRVRSKAELIRKAFDNWYQRKISG